MAVRANGMILFRIDWVVVPLKRPGPSYFVSWVPSAAYLGILALETVCAPVHK